MYHQQCVIISNKSCSCSSGAGYELNIFDIVLRRTADESNPVDGTA